MHYRIKLGEGLRERRRKKDTESLNLASIRSYQEELGFLSCLSMLNIEEIELEKDKNFDTLTLIKKKQS